MRNLIIQRRKTFIASLITMKVYIEDIYSNDLVINNIPCRKIGELKNGEQKSFLIDEYQRKVFVIADKISKNYCNDFYIIPTGYNDVFLTGQNKFDLTTGNAFRFDNNNNINVIEARKKGSYKGIIVLIISILLGYFLGYFIFSKPFLINNGQDKIDSINQSTNDYINNDDNDNYKIFNSSGINIYLPNDFRKTYLEDYTFVYGTDEVLIMGIKEDFSLIENFENYTLEEYGNLVIQNNDLIGIELKSLYGLKYFEYEYEDSELNNVYVYYSFVYKSNDAFWLIQFATDKTNSSKYFSQIIEWAKSVKFE